MSTNDRTVSPSPSPASRSPASPPTLPAPPATSRSTAPRRPVSTATSRSTAPRRPGQYGDQPQYGSPPPGQYGDQPPGQYGQYGQGYGAAPDRPKRNGLGIAALVLGILAVLTSLTVIGGILFGLVAIILGVLGRGRAKRGEASNGGMALTGAILGVLGMLLAGGILALGLSFLNSDEGKTYQQCLEDAGSDRARVDQCAQDFQRDIQR
jgi:hypothetical protein